MPWYKLSAKHELGVLIPIVARTDHGELLRASGTVGEAARRGLGPGPAEGFGGRVVRVLIFVAGVVVVSAFLFVHGLLRGGLRLSLLRLSQLPLLLRLLLLGLVEFIRRVSIVLMDMSATSSEMCEEGLRVPVRHVRAPHASATGPPPAEAHPPPVPALQRCPPRSCPLPMDAHAYAYAAQWSAR
jgi:hypothetical protein